MKSSIKIAVGLIGLGLLVAGVNLAMSDIPAQNSDPEILGVLLVVEQNDIQGAQLAEEKNIDDQLLNYARVLDSQNNEYLNKTRDLSQELGLPITDNAFLDNLRKEWQQDLAVLINLNGKPFAQLYVADVIKEYSETLNWIDSQEAQNQEIKDFLKENRIDLSLHLQYAQHIQEHQTAVVK